MKISWWKLIRKARQIRKLIEVVIELVKYIVKHASDPKLNMMADKIKDLLFKIFNKKMI